jgi:replication factor C subunit 3/5
MDHIPWVEKYRPQVFDEIILEKQNQLIFKTMLTTNNIPNLLFYGPPGTGKTTTIVNLINNYQKKNKEEFPELIVHLNASDDRGIETIRNQISSFTTSCHLFNKGTKFIILDEVDYMTKAAQLALYNLMKNESKNVRFFLICNYISKLERPLRNICMSFKFNSLPKVKIRHLLKNILHQEKLPSLPKAQLENIISNYNSDIRSMINFLQRSHNISKTKIISKKDIKSLVDYFIKNKNKSAIFLEKKVVSYLYLYNIEKNDLIIKVINYIISDYPITDQLINFIRIVIRYEDYYLPEFNIFFISNMVSLLSN